MIVNHENDAEFYLVINNAEYSMHVVCAMKLLQTVFEIGDSV